MPKYKSGSNSVQRKNFFSFYDLQSKLRKIKSKGLFCPGPDFVYGAVTTFQDGGAAEGR